MKNRLPLKLILIGFTAIVISLVGCASKNFGEPKTTKGSVESIKKTFAGSYTDVWNATLKILEDRNFALTQTRKDRGVITTDWISGKSDRLYSGYGDSRIPYNIRYRFVFDIQPTKSGTRVEIINHEQYYTDAITGGFDFQGSLYQWLDTASSGEKERVIIDELAQLLPKNK